MTAPLPAELVEALRALPLVDHHVHGVVRTDLDRSALEAMITESFDAAPPGTTWFDSPVGFAIRRHCAPVLDLEPHAGPDEYVQRRRDLGVPEVNRRLLGTSGVAHLLIDTGHRADEITDVAETAAIAGQRTDEVVRLEPVAETLAAEGVQAAGFADAFATRLAGAATSAVGLKTIIAYRAGLDFDPEPPSRAEVTAAAARWLARGPDGERWRLADPVLLRHLVWTGLELGLPLQFHVGYGDPDLDLHRSNPLLMTDFLRASRWAGAAVMLLHCYPYHREAAYLAHVFPHVHFDVGEAVNYTGASSRTVLAESLELAPFGKILFSSDAWGPAELHHLGAVLWRRGIAAVLGDLVTAEEWSLADAVRVATMIGVDNARRVYRLDP